MYIEREALIATVNEWEFSIEDFVCFVQDLEKIPAADVAPVVHGEWDEGKCTACGWDGPYRQVCEETPYCPNCGAKMNKEE